jgi:acyl-CoA synthetase (AMP-forming)/AMP-acid ligase II
MRGYAGNLGLLFANHANSDRLAIVDLCDPAAPREVSYRALEAMCDAVARGLVRAGLTAGDRIGVVSLNRVEFVATLLGAMRAGVVPVPVNIKLTADAIAFILHDAGAKLVFTEAALRPHCPLDMRAVVFDGTGDDGYTKFVDPGSFEPACTRVVASHDA